MTPSQTFDPRDPWARARRIEVFRYAQEKGITEIVETMPKDLMVKRLKAHGVPPPSVPPRPIGANINSRSGDTSPNSHHYTAQPSQRMEAGIIDADDALERDWKQQSSAADVSKMNITEMRKECKRRGIPLVRKDNMISLKAKLNGKDPT